MIIKGLLVVYIISYYVDFYLLVEIQMKNYLSLKKKNDIDFDGHCCCSKYRITTNARDLIKKMLKFDPDERISWE